MRAASSSVEAPKAAIMVVGDEILAGSITDTNTPWLAKLLHRWGRQPSSCTAHPWQVAIR
jgi:molybdopterin-biosynthesis enzyme MoeA-like protein